MIYVDPIQTHPSGDWCHMWSDTSDEELDAFARVMGLRRGWAHTSRGYTLHRFYHYDLRPAQRETALEQGAQPMRLKDYLYRLKRLMAHP